MILYKSKLNLSKDLFSSKSKFCSLTSLTPVISLPLIIVMQLFVCLRAKTWDSKRPSNPKNTVAINKERLKRGLHNDMSDGILFILGACMNK